MKLLFLIIFLVAGCQKKAETIHSAAIHPSRIAASDIKSSFAVVESISEVSVVPEDGPKKSKKNASKSDENFAQAHGTMVSIKKSALGKAFLLSPTYIEANNAPRFTHLMPKVVSFETNGDQLALLELNIHAIYEGIPSTKLIQAFDIQSQDDEQITFKWGMGFSSISKNEANVFSDSPETIKNGLKEEESVVPVISSYIKRAEFQNGHLDIEQLSRVRSGILQSNDEKVVSLAHSESSILLHVRISPYKVNPRFMPKFSTQGEKVGFFEIPRMKKGVGVPEVIASRWDLSAEAGPVTYAIAKNFPDYLLPAVKEGIQYWNLVAGREIVKIELGADPSEIPSYRKIIVNWAPFKTAGFAVASIQSDPISGELLNGNVYITSFFIDGEAKQNAKFESERKSSFAPTGFTYGSSCEFQNPSVTFRLAEEMVSGKESDLSLRMSTDLIRYVVSHEVGHTLGLRHNFAGSLGSELATASEMQNAFTLYKQGNDSGKATSSSVMDYMEGGDEYLLGAFIKKNPLPYDQVAIQWGYGSKKLDLASAPIYCSDFESMRAPILGCEPLDSGRNPIAGHLSNAEQERELLPNMVLAKLISDIRPGNPAYKKSIPEAVAALTPKEFEKSILTSLEKMYQRLSKNGRTLRVERDLKGLSWMNEEEVVSKSGEYLQSKYAEVNGFAGVLRSVYPFNKKKHSEVGWFKKSMDQLLDNPKVKDGITLDGIHYTLLPEEIAELKSFTGKMGHFMEEAVLEPF